MKYLLLITVILLLSCIEETELLQQQQKIPDFNSQHQPSEILITSNLDNIYGIPANVRSKVGGGQSYGYFQRTGNEISIESNISGDFFKQIVENAQAGQIIYIKPNVNIEVDCSCVANPGPIVTIPEGVSITSNRGEGTSNGAQITFNCHNPIDRDDRYHYSIFEARQYSRIIGLTIDGRNFGITGIKATAGGNVELENCLIQHCGTSAVWLYGLNNHVHHNDISNNKISDEYEGYGVLIGSYGSATIEANVFSINRHHITGGGNNDSYKAFHNIFNDSQKETAVDMHGYTEHPTRKNDCTREKEAGGLIVVHHNEFSNQKYSSISVRGIPNNGCFIYNNYFSMPTDGIPISQRRYVGNLYSYENEYSINGNKWKVTWGGRGSWQTFYNSNEPFENSIFGDFDGDGKDDILRKNDVRLQFAECHEPPIGRDVVFESQLHLSNYENSAPTVSEGSYPEGISDWKYLNVSNVSFETIIVGDFDGDEKTDLLKVQNGIWQLLSAGTGGWISINNSSAYVENLRVGDFDGDGKDDIFTTFYNYDKQRGEFHVSYGANTGWQILNHSDAPIAELIFGKFDDDRKTDIIRISGERWDLLSGGKGNWQTINNLDGNIDNMKVGDFNEDGMDDVFMTSMDPNTGQGAFVVSWGAVSNWERINSSEASINNLRFADLDGDNRTDIITIWQSSIY